MFETIDYLQLGNEKQQRAYAAIEKLKIMSDLADYSPILCGTLPIGVDIEISDLDIIMNVHDLMRFENKISALYGEHEQFKLKRLSIRSISVVKANFHFGGFEFELFGQPVPVEEQYAFQHMVIEKSIMDQCPDVKGKIIELKKQGMKTEPAFCKILELEGDPYEELLKYGKLKGFI
ncbi:DUF4269 domain-containing protein [Cytobacillus horneckiae]|uniref:DUF4269 domain-containing protein n=1 Tax=Cytobacillus horneckiae TaxID=549687 RepID=UPI003D1ADC4B